MNNQQEKTPLSSDEKRELKKMAHHLKPVVLLGKKGLSAALISEIARALEAHELIKIQIAPTMREQLDQDLQEIVEKTSANHIDTIGNVIILFKKRKES